MKPDDILRPCDYEYYHDAPVPPGGFPGYDKPRTPHQLQVDLNVAHDRLKQQVRVNDKLLSNLHRVEIDLGRERKWRQLLLTALALTWASWITAIWWISKVVAPLVVKGMAR